MTRFATMGGEFALVFAADEGFALPLAVAMRSALAKLSRAVPVDVFVIDNGLSASSRGRVRTAIEGVLGDRQLRWVAPPAERLADIVISDARFTPASYSRLLAADLVPEHTQRLVYLDSDVLVMRDLAPLFTVSLGDAPVGAVRDFAIPSTDHELSGVRESPTPRPYFNAGVLVIDVSRWRSLGVTDQALHYAAVGSEPLPLVDQDALNAVVRSWHELDYRWNVQQVIFWGDRRPRSPFSDDVYRQRRDLVSGAAVLHFVGGPKPWHPLCTLPGTTAWVRTMVQTGWYSRGRTIAWVLRYLRVRARHRLGTARREWPRQLRRESYRESV